MELKIEQALQQGIAAHKEGNLQEAERLYRAILKSQPLHPDANHNLGIIAVSVGKAEAALLFFKIALDANPKIEQFWLSYIKALIEEKQFDTAKQLLKQAKNQGVVEEKLNILEGRIASLKSSIFSKKQQKLAVNKNMKTRKKNLKVVNPPEEELNNLLQHYKNGRHSDAEKLALSITQEFPKHQFGWTVLGAVFRESGRLIESLVAFQKSLQLEQLNADAHYNLANVLQELGRLEEAEASYTKAIVLKSNYAKAHNNLSVVLKDLGRLEEAEASSKQAIALKSNYAEAHNNLGIILQELGRLDESEPSMRKAIALKPDYAEAHSNLGVTLQELGRLDEAISFFIQAITFNPGLTNANINFSKAIKDLSFNSSNPGLYPILSNLLTVGNIINPKEIAHSILSLIKHDPLIKNLLVEKNVAGDIKKVASVIGALNKLPLLHNLMRLCPLIDLQLEEVFVAIRRGLLTNLEIIKVAPELIHFLSTLSIHCFTNEYIYFQSDEEIRLIDELEAKVEQAITQSEQPQLIDILCLASYRPLHHYDWCQNLEILDHLEEVKKRLIEEPFAEKVIAKNIPMLGEIKDEVSLKVREQYEENPYPRWVKLAIPIKPRSIAAVCDHIKLHLHSENIKDVSAPKILIAGCGTGHHSIGSASRFSDCQVTAVDLSLASLAYAKRKTIELGITNLEYLQADILKLDQLEKKFDIIESSGVLHHMNDPMAGLRVLANLLKPGGLMKLGLYSELARRYIVKAREKIALQKIGTSENEIRKFREALIVSNTEEMLGLRTSHDFYSLSSLRDLIFHVQEYRFTLPEIKNCLDKFGLKFCGFENREAVSSFRELHGEEADIYDLGLWHQCEESDPNIFSVMYQFWCQKV